tara:strand:+ start:3436 stop:6288 length:2853 start_codon:yes stop_codon:yes gene_type:complete
MNGTVNPLYGGNNMNGGAANKLQAEQDETDTTQQNMLYQGQQTANGISQKSLAEQPKQRAQQYDSLNTNIRHSLGSRAKNRPMEAMAQNTAANLYRKTPGVDSVGKVFAGVTKDIKQTSNITSDKITSIIFTVMQALSNSFTGGMNGMKAELEKISSEQEDSGDNAMVNFLKDCGSFLNFFIQYTTVNKQLQYKITHPDDDDLLAPQQKAYIRGIKKQLDGETEFPDNVTPDYDNKEPTKPISSDETQNSQIQNPTTYFYDVTNNPPKWVEYMGTEINGLKVTNEEKDQIKKDILKQRKQYLKKLNNIELEFYQEKLNNAFQYLTYTYGQLSGRTLYNLSKLLAAGGAKDVGLFAPISLGSLSGSAVRTVPGAGPVIDTINDFFSAFTMAFKMSYKTLKQERKLASDYIDTTAKESSDKLKTLQTGGDTNVEYINKKIFRKITGKKEKKGLDGEEKNFNKRAEKISGKSGHHELSDVSEFSKAKAESDLEMLNQILYDYNHLMSLKKLFKRVKKVVKGQTLVTTSVGRLQSFGEDANYYIGEEKKNDKIKKINKEELKALTSNDELKKKFGELVTLLDGLSKNPYSNAEDKNKEKLTSNQIYVNNPMLYNIVKQFIKTTYEEIKDDDTSNTTIVVELAKLILLLHGYKGANKVGDDATYNLVESKKTSSNIFIRGLQQGLANLKEGYENKTENKTEELKHYDKMFQMFFNDKPSKTPEKDGEDPLSSSGEKNPDEQIKKLTKIINDEQERIKVLMGKNPDNRGDSKDIPAMIEKHREILNKNLEKYRDAEIKAINDEIVASNSFKPLKKLLSKYRSTLKTKIQEMNSALKSNDNMYNTDKVKGTGNMIGFDRKTQLETDKLIRSALEKILNFIAIKDFKAFNEAASKIESGMKSLMSSGGSMRSSTIKRRIKKATRRIQLSLDEFNSGRNTRRGRYRKKPRKTRRVNYGH